MLTVGGLTKTIAEWSKLVDMSPGTLYKRLEEGWPPEKAIAIPAMKRGARIHKEKIAAKAAKSASKSASETAKEPPENAETDAVGEDDIDELYDDELEDDDLDDPEDDGFAGLTKTEVTNPPDTDTNPPDTEKDNA